MKKAPDNHSRGRSADYLYQSFLGVVAFALALNVSVVYFGDTTKDAQSPSRLHRKEHRLPTFAICLLTKDDLGILPEWLAYHYHAVALKHVVVAVDPSSTTNPKPLLERFRINLPDLTIDQWSDDDFMPDFFLNGTYDFAPNFLGVELHDKQTYGEWLTTNHVPRRKADDMRHVNNHRYRQTRFISQCARHLKEQHPKKTVLLSLLDSDEFLAVNPWILRDQFSPGIDAGPSWHTFKAGSVLQWLVDSKNLMTTASPCIQVPRLLFGSVERNSSDDFTVGLVRHRSARGGDKTVQLTSSMSRAVSPFETLRWKYHAAWNDTRNFQQKVILNLPEIPANDEIFGDHINSVHRPSRQLCPPESSLGEAFATSAVAAFHYIGSMERYFARPKDLRRNRKRYRDRSNLTFAVEPGWIDQWLEGFVKSVGMEVAATLLESYVMDII